MSEFPDLRQPSAFDPTIKVGQTTPNLPTDPQPECKHLHPLCQIVSDGGIEYHCGDCDALIVGHRPQPVRETTPVPKDLQARYEDLDCWLHSRDNEPPVRLGSKDEMKLIERIAQAEQRAAKAEVENARLNKMRTHCENCGADYMATGIESCCPCQLQKQLHEAERTCSQLADGVVKYKEQVRVLSAPVSPSEQDEYFEESAGCDSPDVVASIAKVNALIAARVSASSDVKGGDDAK